MSGYVFMKLNNDDKKSVLNAIRSSPPYYRQISPDFSLRLYASRRLRSDRQVVLEAVKKDGRNLEYASEELRNDKEIVRVAMYQIYANSRSNREVFQWAGEKLRSDRKFILESVRFQPMYLRFADKKYQNDKDIVMEALKHDSSSFDFLSFLGDEVLKDQEVVLEAVKRNGEIIRKVCEELKNHYHIALLSLRTGAKFRHLGSEIRNNRNFYLEATKLQDIDYDDIGDELRDELMNDKEFVLERALKEGPDRLKDLRKIASFNLLNDKDFIMKLMKIDKRYLQFVGEHLKEDSEYMQNFEKEEKSHEIMVRVEDDETEGEDEKLTDDAPHTPHNRSNIIKFIEEMEKTEALYIPYMYERSNAEIRNDREVVHKACSINGTTLQYVSSKFSDDSGIVFKAVQSFGRSLQYASERIRNNEKLVVLKAVETSGEALEFAGGEMRKDRDIVSLSVKNDGKSLRFADYELRNDVEIAKIAVGENGEALEYAGEMIRNNEEIVIQAIKNSGEKVIKFAGEKLKVNVGFFLNIAEKRVCNIIDLLEELRNDQKLRNNKSLFLNLLEFYKNKDEEFQSVFEKASDDIKRNKEFFLKVIRMNPSPLRNLSPHKESEFNLILASIEENFDYMGVLESLQDLSHRKIVLESMMKGLEKKIFNVGKEEIVDILKSSKNNESTKITFESFEKYKNYFLKLSSTLFKLGDVHGSLSSLVIYFQFRMRSTYSSSTTEEKKGIVESEDLKKKILKNLCEESDDIQNLTIPLIQKLENISWIHLEDDISLKKKRSKKIVPGFSTNSWEDKDISDMKSVLFNRIRGYFEKVVFEFFQNDFDHHIRNLSKKFYRVRSSNNTSELDRMSEFTDHVEEKTREIFDVTFREIGKEYFEKFMEEFYKKMESDFSPYHSSNNIVDETTSQDKNSQKKYFGFIDRDSSSFTSSKVYGYGFEYLEFSKGNLMNRKTFCRRLFYGKFVNGKRHGDQCMEFSSKDGSLTYEGSFRNGKKQGKGVEYELVKGFEEPQRVFEGKFFNGSRHGRGESYDQNTGEVKRGIWNNGVLDNSSLFKFECPIIQYSEVQKHLIDTKIVGKGAYGVIYVVKSSVISFLKKKKSKKKKKKNKKKKKKNKMENYVAVKIMRVRTKYEGEVIYRMVRRGIGLCFSVKSQNILESYGIIRGKNEVGYVMKLCEKSIDDVIDDCGDTNLEVEEKMRILKETAEGMKSLHKKLLIHRDLKWGNVLMDYDGVVKITDFDTLKEDEYAWRVMSIAQSSRIGTPGFRPPEVHIGKKFSLKSDVYSFGLMIYSLLWETKFPYSTQFQCSCGAKMTDIMRCNSLEEHVSYCNLRPILYPEEVKEHPAFLIDLMIQCWDKSPFVRPSFEEIVMRFELQKRKHFVKIKLQFPSHEGVCDQFMYAAKPFERQKVIDWIENKFNSLETREMKIKDFGEEEEEETEGEDDELKKNIETKTSVVTIGHDVTGSVFSDVDLEKIIESNSNPTLQITLNHVNYDSYFLRSMKAEPKRSGQISKKEFEEKENEVMILKEENKTLRKVISEKDEEIQNLKKLLDEKKTQKND